MTDDKTKAPSFKIKSGVTTVLTHTIPILNVRIGINPALAESEDDTFTLSSSDGKYKKTLTIKDDKVAGDEFVDLVFENLKISASYTLEVNPGKEGSPYNVFEDIPFQELVDYYSLLEPGDEIEENEDEEPEEEEEEELKEEDDDWENDGGDDSQYGGDPDEDSSEMESIIESENEEEEEEIDWDREDPETVDQSDEDKEEEVPPFAEW
jgi:hypothetical protein